MPSPRTMSDVVAFDTETFLIAPGTLAPPLVVLSWAEPDPNGEGDRAGLVAAEDAGEWFAAALARGARIVGHNLAFDLAVMLAEFPALRPAVAEHARAGLFSDTQLREQLLDIAKGSFRFVDVEATDGETIRQPIDYALASIAARRCGATLDKSGDSYRLRYAELADVPPEQWPDAARSYAIEDARATLAVWRAQATDPAAATLCDEAAQVRAALALHALSSRGVVVDLAAVDALAAKLSAERQATRAALAPLGIYRPDGSKDTGALRALVENAYRAQGLPVPMTGGGAKGVPAVATSGAVLKDSGDPRLAALAAAGAVEKLLTAFIPGLRTGAVAPLTCRYNVLVESGRTSCAGVKVGTVKGVQLQQLPRAGGVRECFVPRPGFLLASVDYDTLELRALAQACLDLVGYSAMAEALRGGADLHLDLAASLLGIGYAEAKARKAEPAIKAARQRAKPVNFGFPGGLGVERFMAFAWQQYGVRFSRSEAEGARSAWRNRWPEVVDLQRRVGAAIDPVSETCNVVQLRSGRLRGRVRYTEACNTFFQGLAADGAKRALFRVWDEGDGRVFPVAFLHDEVLAEVPEATAAESAELLARLMVEAMAELIPDVPVSASPAIMRRWYKGAEPVYRDGVLVPWEPCNAGA